MAEHSLAALPPKDVATDLRRYDPGVARGQHRGRLELTWTNKDQRLLADEDGSYQWLPPSDYRVAEVRLLHEASRVGKVNGKRRRAEDNLLIRGDALPPVLPNRRPASSRHPPR